VRRAAPILAALLLLAAYWPALGAGWIWDDDSYVWRNAVVQSPAGIVDCWVPGRTPQWYPLVFPPSGRSTRCTGSSRSGTTW
jgi:hypothetical protein